MATKEQLLKQIKDAERAKEKAKQALQDLQNTDLIVKANALLDSLKEEKYTIGDIKKICFYMNQNRDKLPVGKAKAA